MANKTNYYSDGSTVYQADDFRAPLAAAFNSGVFSGYNVLAGNPADLAVSVQGGTALVNTYLSRDDAPVSVPIAANTSGYNRIDLIVIDIDFTNSKTTLKAVQGVPSSAPVVPTVLNNQLALAQVLVGNNASVINQNVITDVRIFAKLAQMPAANDLPWAATINGFSTIPTVCTGATDTNYMFLASPIQAGGVYLVSVVTNYHPAGSTLYRNTACAILSLPIGWDGTSIAVFAKLNVLAAYTGTTPASTTMGVSVEGGGLSIALSTFNASPHIYLFVPKDSGVAPDTAESYMLIKKLI